MKAPEEIKKEIDDCINNCKKIIFESIDKLNPVNKEKESAYLKPAQVLIAQRITNYLWSWSHPNAGHIIYEQMKEGVKNDPTN